MASGALTAGMDPADDARLVATESRPARVTVEDAFVSMVRRDARDA